MHLSVSVISSRVMVKMLNKGRVVGDVQSRTFACDQDTPINTPMARWLIRDNLDNTDTLEIM